MAGTLKLKLSIKFYEESNKGRTKEKYRVLGKMRAQRARLQRGSCRTENLRRVGENAIFWAETVVLGHVFAFWGEK